VWCFTDRAMCLSMPSGLASTRFREHGIDIMVAKGRTSSSATSLEPSQFCVWEVVGWNIQETWRRVAAPTLGELVALRTV